MRRSVALEWLALLTVFGMSLPAVAAPKQLPLRDSFGVNPGPASLAAPVGAPAARFTLQHPGRTIAPISIGIVGAVSPPATAETSRTEAGSADPSQELTAWQRYRWRIMAVLAVCLVEAGLIVALWRALAKRRRAEALMRESEARFRTVADSAPVLIWVSGTDRLCTYVNQQWLDFTGRTLEQELGNGWAEGVHPEHLAECLSVYTTAFARRVPFNMEYRLRRADGTYRWIFDKGSPRYSPAGDFLGYIGSCIDITDRKRVEEDLTQSIREVIDLKTTLDQHTILGTTDPQGKITYVNDKFCAITKFSREELMGQDHRIVNSGYHPREFFRDLWTTIKACRVWQGDIRIRAKDGSIHWLATTIVPFLDAAGKPRQYMAIRHDITERNRAEETARELSRRLINAQEEERARLARELHDDITQRLARLAIDAGRVEREAHDAPTTGTMRAVREELARLSEDVHTLSYRLHPSLLEDLGLPEALKAECDRFSRQTSVPVGVKSIDLPVAVPRDAALCLFRIAQGALRNVALHAQANAVEVSLRGLDGGLQLAVRDNGVGFDPALPRRAPGLGLASMRERAHLLGGELDAESAPGQGTTIVAWVPLKKG